MKRLTHGEVLILDPEEEEIDAIRAKNPTWRFDFMFSDLQSNEENLLKTSPETVADLRLLGAEMEDPGESTIPGVPVPAIHTFFGQFVDHDITLERGSQKILLSGSDPTLEPLSLADIARTIVNSRSPNLDLDQVYGPDIDGRFAPRDPINPDKLLLGKVADGHGLPFGKDVWNDFHRLDDGSPLIGDSRNDENVIVGQLHIAFIKAHNAIVDRGFRFEEARKLLIQHYQWIVLDEFLEHIADPVIVRMVRFRGPRFFNPSARTFFMPLEFTVAAFRFGHSKVRASYDNFNNVQFEGGLDLLFRPGRTLFEHWIISWPSFLDPENKGRFPRPIDTSLTQLLTKLPPDVLAGQAPEPNLATRNLLRGYILRMPTGQAVARTMADQGIKPMTRDEILSVTDRIIRVKVEEPEPEPQPHQSNFLKDTEKRNEFLTKTPLWFYILAEAAFYSRGHRLGPVGSTIVAEVLIGVLRNSSYSILSDSQWKPTLGDTAKFDLEDLLKLAGVFS